MELFLDNVGIIKDSTVKIDGLTVITGKNSSGKTTVGKVLYAIVRAKSNIEKAYLESRNAYIVSQLDEISDLLTLSERIKPFFFVRENASNQKDTNSFLYSLEKSSYRKMNSDKLFSFLAGLDKRLTGLTLEELNKYEGEHFVSLVNDKRFGKTIERNFEEKKKNAIQIYKQTVSLINDPNAFERFATERIRTFLNFEFRNQVKPVRKPRATAYIRVIDDKNIILNLKVLNKANFQLIHGANTDFPYNQAIFIDDPFILDRIEYGVDDDIIDYDVHKDVIYSQDASSSRKQLVTLLAANEPKNFFNKLELQNKYSDVFDKINLIVPGEFQKTNDGRFYIDDNAMLNVQNLATGSKLFFIVKILLMNGNLNDGTILVLDEPESHLHPEWINKFAEILVLLIKELHIHVLLTTHSPNLLLALDYYSNTYGVSELSHFYLAQTVAEGWSAKLDCIDGNINKGYAHLSLPLIKMSIKQKAIVDREKK